MTVSWVDAFNQSVGCHVLSISLILIISPLLLLKKVKVIQLCLTLCNPGQNTGVGSLSLQGIFPNPGLPHCRWILYLLSHRGSPEYWSRTLSLLQWIFLTQEWNRDLLPCRCIPYQLSHQGSLTLKIYM